MCVWKKKKLKFVCVSNYKYPWIKNLQPSRPGLIKFFVEYTPAFGGYIVLRDTIYDELRRLFDDATIVV